MMLKYVMGFFLVAVISYLLGSCNSAIITVKLLKHKDIREYGSKNAGLTNTLRCFGKGCALLTLAGDMLKGVLAVFISKGIFSVLGIELFGIYGTRTVGYIAGIFAVLGHVFPIYYQFKGGKGVLVTASVMLAVDPLTFLIVILLFVAIVAVTKYVSVGSIASAGMYPIVTFISQYYRNSYTIKEAYINTALATVTAVMIMYMHKANMERLKNGTENKFSFKRKE